ncbi:hypothetical protein [Roseomonas sp. AR75]|uniref:hypothetical protein n=1 Tax=Roseomonas sp. AR75 TaxID=2562311 RepID=UPI0010C0DC97|nr:hypothetical protein [Roseomonas sp. AR75]
MPQLIVVGLFDSRAEAEEAASHLRKAGVGPSGVAVHATQPAPSTEAPAPPLRLSALPEEDRAFYREGLRRGAVPVAVLAEERSAGRMIAIFAACGAADLDAREAAWRAEGWTGTGSDTGYTDHDEDIGFATYGGDVVIRRIPRQHHDDMPAGLLGRLEMAAMQDLPEDSARRARCYTVLGEESGSL